MRFFGHPLSKLFWLKFWLDSCEMTIFFMSHFILQINYSGCSLASDFLSLHFHLFDHWFNSRRWVTWSLKSGPIIVETVPVSQIFKCKLRLQVPDGRIRCLILISFNYSSHPTLILRHKHGCDIGPLCLYNNPFGPFLHLIEISELRGRAEPAEYGLCVAYQGAGSCGLQHSPIDLGGLDEQPVGVERVQHLPVQLDVLQHLLVLEVASVLLEIQLNRALVWGRQLDVVHF